MLPQRIAMMLAGTVREQHGEQRCGHGQQRTCEQAGGTVGVKYIVTVLMLGHRMDTDFC